LEKNLASKAAVEKDLVVLKGQLATEEEKSANLISQTTSLQGQITELNNKLAWMDKNKKAAQDEAAELKTKLGAAEGQKVKLSEQINKLNNDITTATQNFIAFREEKTLLEQRLKTAQEELEISKEQYSAGEEERGTLGIEIASLKQELSDINKRLTEEIAAKAGAEKEIADLNAEKQVLNEKVSGLVNAIKEREERVTRLTADLELARGNIADKDAESRNLNTMLIERQGEITSLNQKFEKAEREISVKQREIDELRSTLEKNRKDLGKAKQELSTARARRDLLEAAQKASLADIERLQAQVKGAREEIGTLKDAKTMAEAEVISVQDKLTTAMAEVGDLQARLDVASEELQKAGQEKKELEAEMSRIFREKEQLAANVDELSTGMRSMTGTVTAGQAKEEKLREKIAGLQKAVAEREADIKSLKGQTSFTPTAPATASSVQDRVKQAMGKGWERLQGLRAAMMALPSANGEKFDEDRGYTNQYLGLWEQFSGLALALHEAITQPWGVTAPNVVDQKDQVLVFRGEVDLNAPRKKSLMSEQERQAYLAAQVPYLVRSLGAENRRFESSVGDKDKAWKDAEARNAVLARSSDAYLKLLIALAADPAVKQKLEESAQALNESRLTADIIRAINAGLAKKQEEAQLFGDIEIEGERLPAEPPPAPMAAPTKRNVQPVKIADASALNSWRQNFISSAMERQGVEDVLAEVKDLYKGFEEVRNSLKGGAPNKLQELVDSLEYILANTKLDKPSKQLIEEVDGIVSRALAELSKLGNGWRNIFEAWEPQRTAEQVSPKKGLGAIAKSWITGKPGK
ncbi:MAG: hypothetical protein ABIB65_03175, partial [Candidatus Margulisiibacteriota bacterium]